MIDGGVLQRLNDAITEAIVSHPQDGVDGAASSLAIDGFTFQTTSILDHHIQRVQDKLQATVSRYEPANFEIKNASGEYFRGHKCSAKSGVQMAIQLAVRRHFGYNPAAFEPVSLGHFKGRVERAHAVVPEVANFCAAASDKFATLKNPDLRRLFFEGVKAHTNSVMRTSRGHGIDRHLLCLEWSLHAGDEVPALFASPLHKKTQPSMVATDCWASGALECGSIQPDEGSFWMHFEVEDDR